MNPSKKTENSKSPSRIRGKVLYHNITKVSKKKLKAMNSVRSFWVKYLKPELECHPQICMTKIFRDIVKVKEVSIKKIKELVHQQLIKKESFKTAVQFSQEVIEIIKRNPKIEEEYPTHTKKLIKWFEEILKTKEDDVVVVTKTEVKVEAEEKESASPSSSLNSMHRSNNCTCYNYPIINGVVAIPVEFLFRLQDQISYLIQNQIKSINPPDNQSLGRE
jgi:hypothetical protein